MGNGIVYIDKVGLQELIEYHTAEFEITDGYYFNEGKSTTINHAIKDSNDLRKKLKQNKNPAQMVIKLLMVSMYGKTIMKPVETYTIVKDNRNDFEKQISYNYNYIDSIIDANGKLYIKRVKSILSHVNYAHCGVEILSMRKIIMNKVFSCADDCDIKTYCQDTDSTHLNYDDVGKIENGYREKYGSELVGEELGNSHIDFSMDNANTEVHAIENVFLGKKTYIHI